MICEWACELMFCLEEGEAHKQESKILWDEDE